MTAPALSVCIPAYAMHGVGEACLAEALGSLAAQDFAPFEVVVADQDESGGVARACAAFAGRLDLRRVPNDAPRGGSANANVALDAARGRWVKLLFQDDWLPDAGALSRVAAALAGGAGWVATGCLHAAGGRVGRPHRPRWHGAIRFGRNTIGAPSVVALQAAAGLRFDPGLRWLMDVEFYHRAALTFGPPRLLPAPGAVIRLHAGQVSAGVDTALARAELAAVAARHPPAGAAERLELWLRRRDRR